MEKKILEKVCQTIYKQFPFIEGKQPSVTSQGEDRYLLLFSNTGETPDGKNIKQTVRVVATEDGRIIKSSMSR